MRIDVHQHIWTEPLLRALTDREALPFVRRDDGRTVLHSTDEHSYPIDCSSETRQARAALLRSDGLQLALVAISSPVGIEALPREQALELIDAHLTGVSELGSQFAAWGPLTLDEPEPADVDELLARGCVGVSLPAPALAGFDALDAVGPLLERIEQRDVPLLIHPGRALGRPPRGVMPNEPLWWSALTEYVSQMQAAWLTFATAGRPEHPELRIVFAMLAGGAPLQLERLSARGGPAVEHRDPVSFYDTSSYGPLAIEAIARRVGPGQLLFGSDRPVIEPVDTGRNRLLQEQAAQLVTNRTAPA